MFLYLTLSVCSVLLSVSLFPSATVTCLCSHNLVTIFYLYYEDCQMRHQIELCISKTKIRHPRIIKSTWKSSGLVNIRKTRFILAVYYGTLAKLIIFFFCSICCWYRFWYACWLVGLLILFGRWGRSIRNAAYRNKYLVFAIASRMYRFSKQKFRYLA